MSYLVLAVPQFGAGAVVADLFAEGRFIILIKESGVLVLGLLAYGAVALFVGTFFNSALYALFLLAWEMGLPNYPATWVSRRRNADRFRRAGSD